MNWLQRQAYNYLKKTVVNQTSEENNLFTLEELNRYFGQGSLGEDISEITYFTCLKVLSESVGKMSIHLKDRNNNVIEGNDGVKALKVRPNHAMTPTVFKSLLEYHRNHYGNAYAYLAYNKQGVLEGIYPLEPRNMKILIDNAHIFSRNSQIYYEYMSPKNNKTYRFRNEEILHLKGGISSDGIVGMSVRETLARTLKGSKESQRYLNNLYEKGLTAKAIIKYTGDFDKGRKKELTKELLEFAGGSESDGIIPIPMGMDLVPLDLKLTDSQFYELKKYTALQIAGAFGIKPNHLNNYEKSSYANSEMQNLTFYIDTLLYILTQYEEEFNYKMLTEKDREKGLRYEFNVASILRGDLKTQAESLTKYTAGSVYKINEARKKAGLPPTKGGDVILVNGSYVDLENVGEAYVKGGDK
ncbi:phage portal protein [Filifactor alocis]